MLTLAQYRLRNGRARRAGPLRNGTRRLENEEHAQSGLPAHLLRRASSGRSKERFVLRKLIGLEFRVIFRVIFFCRMLHFTAFGKHKVPYYAVKWGEKRLILCEKPAKWRAFYVLEQVTGLEPVISAWKANVFPLHYTCAYAIVIIAGEQNLHS